MRNKVFPPNKMANLSEYELERLERIKENQKLLDQLFPEGTKLPKPRSSLPGLKTTRVKTQDITPTKDKTVRGPSCRRLSYNRYNIRRTRKSTDYYDGPLTRGMKTKMDNGGTVYNEIPKDALLDGIDEDRPIRRYYTSRKRQHSEMEEVPIELDGLSGLGPSCVRRVIDSSKNKVYDRINGTTCHQCRQKTKDQKTVCHNKHCNGVRGQFCGPCLKNRYGEEIRECLVDKTWVCPPCRGKCNCSFCLPKKGCPPTGIMIHIAKEAGYDSVQEYLEKSDYTY